MCQIPVVPRGNDFSLKKNLFSDPTGKKRYMMPDATIFSFNDSQIDRAVWNGWDSALEQMSIGARFLDTEERVLEISLVLAKDVQGWDSFQPRLHFRVLWDMDVRTYAWPIRLLNFLNLHRSCPAISHRAFLKWPASLKKLKGKYVFQARHILFKQTKGNSVWSHVLFFFNNLIQVCWI